MLTRLKLMSTVLLLASAYHSVCHSKLVHETAQRDMKAV